MIFPFDALFASVAAYSERRTATKVVMIKRINARIMRAQKMFERIALSPVKIVRINLRTRSPDSFVASAPPKIVSDD